MTTLMKQKIGNKTGRIDKDKALFLELKAEKMAIDAMRQAVEMGECPDSMLANIFTLKEYVKTAILQIALNVGGGFMPRKETEKGKADHKLRTTEFLDAIYLEMLTDLDDILDGEVRAEAFVKEL